METKSLFEAAMSVLRLRAPALSKGLDGLMLDTGGTFTIELRPATLVINSGWFEGLDDEERVSALASAAFRLTSPLLRPCGGRNPFVWNLACSVIANANLVAMGFRLPKGAMMEPSCRDKTSDEVYERIKDIPGLVPAGKSSLN